MNGTWLVREVRSARLTTFVRARDSFDRAVFFTGALALSGGLSRV
jgi:hypothetical protein